MCSAILTYTSRFGDKMTQNQRQNMIFDGVAITLKEH
jgi:hypothetical protein